MPERQPKVVRGGDAEFLPEGSAPADEEILPQESEAARAETVESEAQRDLNSYRKYKQIIAEQFGVGVEQWDQFVEEFKKTGRGSKIGKLRDDELKLLSIHHRLDQERIAIEKRIEEEQAAQEEAGE